MGDIKEFYELQERIANDLSKAHNRKINTEDVSNALILVLTDKENLEWSGWIEDVDLTYEDEWKLLSDFDFNTLKQQVESLDTIFPVWCLFQFRARFKVNGLIWIIHKYDADPFPSNPHAHELTHNIKLDLSNGRCYRVRKPIYTIKKKDLLEIRQNAKKVYHGDLPELTLI